MSSLSFGLAVLTAIAVLACSMKLKQASGVIRGELARIIDFLLEKIAPRHFLVWFPPGYHTDIDWMTRKSHGAEPQNETAWRAHRHMPLTAGLSKEK